MEYFKNIFEVLVQSRNDLSLEEQNSAVLMLFMELKTDVKPTDEKCFC